MSPCHHSTSLSLAYARSVGGAGAAVWAHLSALPQMSWAGWFLLQWMDSCSMDIQLVLDTVCTPEQGTNARIVDLMAKREKTLHGKYTLMHLA